MNTSLTVTTFILLGVGAVVGLILKEPYVAREALHQVASVVPGAEAVLGFEITPQEHGFETSRVVATRYKSDTIGYNIGFTFPKNPYDADRTELSDYIESKSGWVFQGGGSPGAPLYAKFKDVTDRESADVKIKDILPGLSRLIADIGDGKKVVVAKKKPEYEWPNTAPIDKTDPNWEFNNNLNSNGVAYKKAEVEPGKWQWVVDEEAEKQSADWQNHRRQLWGALRSRVLTDDEMKEVANFGTMLNVEPMQSYYADQKAQELQLALAWQAAMRAQPSAAPK